MATNRDYLKLRGNKWYVQVSIPVGLREAAGGRSEYIKSLGTGDLVVANRLKHPYIAAFKQRLAGLERQKGAEQRPAVLNELYAKALAWRETLERHKGDVSEGPDGTLYYATDEFLSQISDEAREYLETTGSQRQTHSSGLPEAKRRHYGNR